MEGSVGDFPSASERKALRHRRPLLQRTINGLEAAAAVAPTVAVAVAGSNGAGNQTLYRSLPSPSSVVKAGTIAEPFDILNGIKDSTAADIFTFLRRLCTLS